MLKLCLVLVAIVGLYVVDADIDAALQSFLKSSTGRSGGAPKPEAIKNLFKVFNKEFSRKQETPREESVRLSAFNRTLNAILKNGRQRSNGIELGLNEFSDWTDEELKKLLGVRLPSGPINETNAKPGQRLLTWSGGAATGRADIPSSYDYTRKFVTGTNVPLVQPIKNQGQCGSCYAFAFNTLVEFQTAVQFKIAKDLSEQQIVDCSEETYGCNGGFFQDTFSHLQNNSFQAAVSTDYPYKGVVGWCAIEGAGSNGVKFGSLIYKKLREGAATAMQKALVNYGPLWVSFHVNNEFFSLKSGIYQPTGCPKYLRNHAVVIVGYGVDSATGTPYWKVRNSWGTGWGESGYFKIRRGVNMCGVESDAYYITRAA